MAAFLGTLFLGIGVGVIIAVRLRTSDFGLSNRCHVIMADDDMSGRWDTRTRNPCRYIGQLREKIGGRKGETVGTKFKND